MPSTTTIRTKSPARMYPAVEVRRRLRRELEKAAEESVVLQGGWEPELDSLRMVSVVLILEDLFDFQLPPERLVRRSGYGSVEEGIADMSDRFERLWKKEHQK